MEVYKIAFTGGPCAGKTRTIDFVKGKLEKDGYYVITIPETARNLITSKLLPNDQDREHTMRFQNYVIRMQTVKEKIAEEYAEGLKNKQFDFIKDKKAIIILYDRSIIDNRGYLNQDDYECLLQKYNYEEIKFMDKFDMVIDLISTATTDKNLYCLDEERNEPDDIASKIDQEISTAWSMHHNIKVLKPRIKIEDKYEDVLNCFSGLLESYSESNAKKLLIDENNTDLSYYNETNSRKIRITNICLAKSFDMNYVVVKRQYNGCTSYISNIDTVNHSNMRPISYGRYLETISTYGIVSTEDMEVINVIDKGNHYKLYNDYNKGLWFIEFDEDKNFIFPKHVKVKTK